MLVEGGCDEVVTSVATRRGDPQSYHGDDAPARKDLIMSTSRASKTRMTAMIAATMLLFAALSLALADPPWGAMKGIHDHKFRTPDVVSAAFSQDNEKVAVSYYRAAMNRPGTDWFSFVATWDLKTGRRTIIGDTIGPVALSADGKWLVAGHYERDRAGRRTQWLPAPLTLFRFGEHEPVHRFTHGEPAPDPTARLARINAPNPVAVAFHPANGHIAWIQQRGQICWANLEEGKRSNRILGTIDIDYVSLRGHLEHDPPTISFDKTGSELTATGVTKADHDQQTIRTMKWKIDAAADKAEKVSDQEKQTPNPHVLGQSRKAPEKAARFFASPDKTIRAVPAVNGIVELFKADEKESFKTLRLDDNGEGKPAR